MMPVHELLSRIRWDPAFGRGRFEIAYLDRATHALVRVPFEQIRIPPGGRFFFEAVTPEGELHSIPLHRIRSVSRDGAVIWQR